MIAAVQASHRDSDSGDRFNREMALKAIDELPHTVFLNLISLELDEMLAEIRRTMEP